MVKGWSLIDTHGAVRQLEVAVDCSADVLRFKFVGESRDVTFTADFVFDKRRVLTSMDEVLEFIVFAKVSWVVFNEGAELEEVVV